MLKLVKYYYCCTLVVAITTIVLMYRLNNYYGIHVSRSAIKSTLKAVPDMKFILVWTLPTVDPIMYLGKGMESFVQRNCPIINCYVSSDRTLLEDITKFDVLVFHSTQLYGAYGAWFTDLPNIRDPNQKYVFASMESSDYYPICEKKYNGYFNWTWTYKLDSDEVYGYITVKNKSGEIVAPKTVMHWKEVETMEPIDDKLKAKLSSKRLAAAWFVSNCRAKNGRLEFAELLKSELALYNLTLDVYGACGTKSCPSKFMKDCLEIVEKDYYFYLSFENSFSEDYVTEKLLHALQHYAVPVVYGGANYTRIMPDGMYLNARMLGVKALAHIMAEMIDDKEKYYNYFRWRNYYSYHYVEEFPESDSYCKLCALINNEKLLRKTSVLEDFVTWWNPPGKCN